MKHYMEKIQPEPDRLNQAADPLSCRNVQIIPMWRKYEVGAGRIWGGCKSNYKMSAIR